MVEAAWLNTSQEARPRKRHSRAIILANGCLTLSNSLSVSSWRYITVTAARRTPATQSSQAPLSKWPPQYVSKIASGSHSDQDYSTGIKTGGRIEQALLTTISTKAYPFANGEENMLRLPLLQPKRIQHHKTIFGPLSFHMVCPRTLISCHSTVKIF